jgi:hypothetical protein
MIQPLVYTESKFAQQSFCISFKERGMGYNMSSVLFACNFISRNKTTKSETLCEWKMLERNVKQYTDTFMFPVSVEV